ncbi:MAG TPA: hypothetical protein VGK77_22885, partial [Candidatus Binatia bacterium]
LATPTDWKQERVTKDHNRRVETERNKKIYFTGKSLPLATCLLMGDPFMLFAFAKNLLPSERGIGSSKGSRMLGGRLFSFKSKSKRRPGRIVWRQSFP